MKRSRAEVSLLCAVLGLLAMPATGIWTRSARWISRFWNNLISPVPSTDYAAISRLIHPEPATATPTRRAVRPARDQRPWIERFTLQRNTFAF